MKHILLFFLSFLTISCTSQGQTESFDFDAAETASFKIINTKTGKSIRIGSTKEEIISAFGTPDSSGTYVDERDDLTYTKMKYNGIEFILYENKEIHFIINNGNYALKYKEAVIKINSDLKNLKPIFPSSFKKLKERGVLLVWLKFKGTIVDENIAFWYDSQGRISRIICGGYD
ncbi:MAG TPA: hypothetical protein VEV16_07420 [Daejeonella sp.]|nr:hypothetical protein [Daejeonella sp.]